ncbi:hypothetical protein EWM64_g2906 [Hericium alpestre]|uniref:Uncharacterized protein n=1 Tax=Hericium alpestre TaxID=135208 RepID=A0A4Z0A236_9AGAM|nr:hypothetical protein EWM64_g2906 [Hericium alpestre]
MRHLFTGPSSAHAFEDGGVRYDNPEARWLSPVSTLPPGDYGGGTRSTNAELIGVTGVTGRMIAYAYVQVRFALSSKSAKDGKFDYIVADDIV